MTTGNDLLNLFEGLCIHAPGQDLVGFLKRIDRINQVDIQITDIHGNLPHPLNQSCIATNLLLSPGCLRDLFRCFLPLLGQIECRHGMLAHSLLILIRKLGIPIPNNFPQPDLCQFLGSCFLIEQTMFQGRLVLHKGCHNFVQIFPANPLRFRAFGRNQPFDLHMELTGLLIKSDIRAVWLVTFLSIVIAIQRRIFFGLRRKLETWRQHLFHKQAGGNGLEHVIDRIRDFFLRCIRFSNQVDKFSPRLTRRITGSTTNDLNDLRQARTVSDRQRLLTPDPVKPFLGHPQRNNDVHMIAVVLLRRILQGSDNLVAPNRLIFHQISNTQHPAIGTTHQMKTCLYILSFPVPQDGQDMLDFLVLLSRAFA
ncbi:hypothetical protein NBRC3278_3392 [Acetobacter pasteurianus NBRC 3278]|uniref:Uncharacterized protein n=1 Tax=Acetobacter pasteurianus NBRC 3278 TaxID=1226660 RepID=A0A401X9F3_ACEPA|nr:hypothetical protein NBRC3278_3392 [Acetobacter pasteurianus NBRC 3278]